METALRLRSAASIAVVDDDPDMLRWLRVTLGTAGFQVQPFAGAADLLAALDAGGQFELVISDVDMPGWNGLQLVQALRRRSPNLPVILLSGRDAEQDLLSGFAAGAEDYLVKPVNPGVVRAKVRRLLAQGSGVTEPAELPDTLPASSARVGDYQLEGELGRGGFGVVYAATNAAGDPVAVKLLYPEVCQDTELLTRYLREVDTLRVTDAPHVVRFLDSGVAAGRHYLVMERVDGQSALERLASGPLEHAEALAIGAQVAEALVTLSAAGVVHRDIKPANLILGPDGHVTLIDFGLAKPEQDQGLTASRDLLGSPSFIAPELIRGERQAWIGSDLYSLGATLYQLLTGKPPHETGEAYATLRAAAEAQEPLSLTLLPPLLERVIASLLHPNPARRLTDPQHARMQLALAAKAARNLERGPA